MKKVGFNEKMKIAVALTKGVCTLRENGYTKEEAENIKNEIVNNMGTFEKMIGFKNIDEIIVFLNKAFKNYTLKKVLRDAITSEK